MQFLVLGVKRIIGQDYSKENVQKFIKSCLYKVEQGDGKPCIHIASINKNFTPEEICSHIIKKLKSTAEEYLKHLVKEAVITVPAYFNDSQRSATKKAAQMAGFSQIHIINEPTAAAIAAVFTNPKRFSRNLLIYDFGGGTFDVSIVKAQGNHCKVLATAGDCFLGGTDMDENLARHVLDKVQNKYADPINVTKDKLRRIRKECENVKKMLSVRSKADVEILNITRGVDIVDVVEREQFNKTNEELFEKTMAIVDGCLKDSGLGRSDINEVVMVGGCSRIPKLIDMMKAKFTDVNQILNPEEAIAFGAAIYAADLYGDKKEVTFEDILSMSLGISVQDELMSVIVKKGTPLPCKEKKSYTTSSDNQSEVIVTIYQGERQLVRNNYSLGKFSITNIKPQPRGQSNIVVEFSFDGQGLLKVTASDTGDEKSESLDIVVAPIQTDYSNANEMSNEEEDKLVRFIKKKHNLQVQCEDLLDKCDDISNQVHKIDVMNEVDLIVEKLEKLCSSDDINDLIELENTLNSKEREWETIK